MAKGRAEAKVQPCQGTLLPQAGGQRRDLYFHPGHIAAADPGDPVGVGVA